MPISLVVEDLADLVADSVIDALNVEFGGQRCLHAVDDREFGVAFFGILSRRWVSSKRRAFSKAPLKRGRERGQQANVGFGESMFAVKFSMAIKPRTSSPVTRGAETED